MATIPAVVSGSRAVSGVDLAAVAELVGVPYAWTPSLDCEELLTRQTQLLHLLRDNVGDFPDWFCSKTFPGRDRTVLTLANHIQEITVRFLDVVHGCDFDETCANAEPRNLLAPEELQTSLNMVAERLNSCDLQPERVVTTYFGDHPIEMVLERCVCHAAQHMRQLHWFAEVQDLKLTSKLSSTLLDSLPLANAVWET